jgi:hypothetical protein
LYEKNALAFETLENGLFGLASIYWYFSGHFLSEGVNPKEWR